MPRAGVTYDEVAKVANQLLFQGLHPSVQRVREITGTGSNTTLSRHLESWRETFDDNQKTILPESVPEDLMSPLDAFWRTALAQAEAKYHQFKVELEEKLNDSVAQQEELSSDLVVQQEKHGELERSFIELQSKYKNLEEESQQHIGENNAYKNTIDSIRADFENARSDYADALLKHEDRLSVQKHDFSRQLKADQERFESAENRMLNEIDSLRQAVAKLQNSEKLLNTEIKTEKLNTQAEIFTLQKKNLVTESQRVKADSDSQLFKKQAESIQTDFRLTQGQHTTILSTIDKLQKKLGLVQNKGIHLAGQLQHCKLENDKLKKRIRPQKKNISNFLN